MVAMRALAMKATVGSRVTGTTEAADAKMARCCGID